MIVTTNVIRYIYYILIILHNINVNEHTPIIIINKKECVSL